MSQSPVNYERVRFGSLALVTTPTPGYESKTGKYLLFNALKRGVIKTGDLKDYKGIADVALDLVTFTKPWFTDARVVHTSDPLAAGGFSYEEDNPDEKKNSASTIERPDTRLLIGAISP